ncbi:DUF1294 domain-containing protein [Caulobacter segnis]
MTIHYEAIASILGSPADIFARLDDYIRLGEHMAKPTAMMGGGKMTYEFDEGRGQAVGSHIRMRGDVFGLKLFVDEVVTEREVPRRKVWKTVGSPKLLVIATYGNGLRANAGRPGLKVASLDRLQPASRRIDRAGRRSACTPVRALVRQPDDAGCSPPLYSASKRVRHAADCSGPLAPLCRDPPPAAPIRPQPIGNAAAPCLGMLTLVALYLLAINALTVVAFASDKRRAVSGDRRVPERTLLGLAALGGAPGAFAARQLFRHKTRKEPFRTQLWLIALAQTVLIVGAILWLGAPEAVADIRARLAAIPGL